MAAISACLTLLVMGLAPTVSASRALSGAQTGWATVAKTQCQYYSAGGPCAPIMSVYAFYGYHEGDLSLIRTKLGPTEVVGHVYKSFPTPGYYDVIDRTFTWHTAAGVEVVGAYIVHFKGKHASYTKLPSGKHTDEATLTETQGSASPPILVLQGRPVFHPAAASRTHCQYASVGGPCAPIMSIYNYFGYHEGDLSLISAKLSPNKIVGHVHKTWPTPGEYEVNERTFTWHSVSNVEIVGVYIQRGVGKGFSYKKLPTGKHSGQAKLTAVTDGSTPSLVLQGRHTS